MSRPLLLAVWACACSGPAPPSTGVAGSSSTGNAASEGGGAGEPTSRVVAAVPVLDAVDVYPAPLWNGNGEEFSADVSFSAAMAARRDLFFEALDHLRPAIATWSDDAKRLTLVARPDFAAPRPLADQTTYSLDLTTLVDETGVGLQANEGLRDGRLVFTTGRYDALLNHSCGHTFFGPFASVGATLVADDSAPDISTTHTEYTVTLRASDGGYGGWLRVNFVAPGQYRLYFDGETRVSLNDSAGNTEALSVLAAPLACPGITHEATLKPRLGQPLFLRLQAKDSPVRRVIVELVPSDASTPPDPP